VEAAVEILIPRLRRLSPAKRAAALYKLRETLDEEDFKYVAALLAVDLSVGENPRRWAAVDPVDVVEDVEELAEDHLEGRVETIEVVDDDEYVGKRVVERLWKSTI